MVRKVDGPQACGVGLSPLCVEREHASTHTYSLRSKRILGCSHLSSLPAANAACPCPDLTLGNHYLKAAAAFLVSLCIEQVKGHLSSIECLKHVFHDADGLVFYQSCISDGSIVSSSAGLVVASFLHPGSFNFQTLWAPGAYTVSSAQLLRGQRKGRSQLLTFHRAEVCHVLIHFIMKSELLLSMRSLFPLDILGHIERFRALKKTGVFNRRKPHRVLCVVLGDFRSEASSQNKPSPAGSC